MVIDWLEVGKVLVPAVAAALALCQYWKNSDRDRLQAVRDRAQTAADEMADFNDDHAVKMALRMLDWMETNIFIAELDGSFRKPYLREGDFHLALRHHSVKRSDAVRGLAPPAGRASWDSGIVVAGRAKEADGYAFTEDEQAIRDIFDHFLGRLEKVEALIRADVIKPENFKDHFSYWLDLIGKEPASNSSAAPLADAQARKSRTLWNYIRGYEFFGVVRLMACFGLTQDTASAGQGATTPAAQ